MDSSKVNALVVSHSQPFRDTMQKGLRDGRFLSDVATAYNVMSVSAMFSKFKINVMILDFESQAVNPAYLKQLTERHNLFIIGVRTLASSDYVKYMQIVKDSFVKPDLNNPVMLMTFLSAVKQKITTYVGVNPKNLFTGMFNTVDTNKKIVAIASSTGGTEALEFTLKNMPKNCPPILIVQHMPIGFTRFFAERLDKICPMRVKETEHGEYLETGTAYIGVSGKHLKLAKRNSRLINECVDGAKLNGVIPAADILFASVAPIMRSNAIGVILTGMGADGAKGMLEMRYKGARTIGQDEASCVVYGMPKVAKNIGAIESELPLKDIPAAIMKLV